MYHHLNKKTLFFYTLLFQLFVVAAGVCKVPIYLRDDKTIYELDSSHFENIDSLRSILRYDRKFLTNKNTAESSWFQFEVINQNNDAKEWLLVSYNYAIDEIDVWTYDSLGHDDKQVFRDYIDVYSRKIIHKQPVFSIHLEPNERKSVRIRIKDEHSYNYVFALFSQNKFFSHFFMEYLLYGVFYGLMIFVILYSIMNAVFFRDIIFVLYTLFIVSQVLHMMFRDGTGLFILSSMTHFDDIIKTISRIAVAVFLLLYTATFLKIKKGTLLYKVIFSMIFLRFMYLFIFPNDEGNISFHIEMFVILFCSILSIRAYMKGFSESKYMSIGLVILTLSYSLYYFSILGFTSLGGFGFFGLYYGVAIESLFMTLALTDRFKKIKLENFQKEQMNRELENMVQQRTETITEQNNMLEKKSEELNLFLYSVSHDFKGPIKTIEGLCIVGEDVNTDNHNKIYGLIKSKLKNLESNINDLKMVSTLKNEVADKEFIDFYHVHEEALSRYKELSGFNKMKVELKIELDKPIYGDAFSVRCIYHNIFENAIKFRDPNKNSFINIRISNDNSEWKMSFEDNGEGINESSLPRIFNMLYRASDNSREDSGMGLFIVHLAVKKLGGKILVESQQGIGSKFTSYIPL